jgi:hypothetical protein
LASKPNHHAEIGEQTEPPRYGEQRTKGEHREEKEKKWKREKEIRQNERERKKISLYRAGKKY